MVVPEVGALEESPVVPEESPVDPEVPYEVVPDDPNEDEPVVPMVPVGLVAEVDPRVDEVFPDVAVVDDPNLLAAVLLPVAVDDGVVVVAVLPAVVEVVPVVP